MMKIIRPGDRVLFHRFHLFKGESIPDIPPSDWTGTVVDTWGFSPRFFYHVKRDYDGRTIPVLGHEIVWIGDKLPRTSSRKPKEGKAAEQPDSDAPVLF